MRCFAPPGWGRKTFLWTQNNIQYKLDRVRQTVFCAVLRVSFACCSDSTHTNTQHSECAHVRVFAGYNHIDDESATASQIRGKASHKKGHYTSMYTCTGLANAQAHSRNTLTHVHSFDENVSDSHSMREYATFRIIPYMYGVLPLNMFCRLQSGKRIILSNERSFSKFSCAFQIYQKLIIYALDKTLF